MSAVHHRFFSSLLEEYAALEQRAETLIDGYVSVLETRSPGVPRPTLRQCTLDARSDGYSYPQVLRYLRERLKEA